MSVSITPGSFSTEATTIRPRGLSRSTTKRAADKTTRKIKGLANPSNPLIRLFESPTLNVIQSAKARLEGQANLLGQPPPLWGLFYLVGRRTRPVPFGPRN